MPGTRTPVPSDYATVQQRAGHAWAKDPANAAQYRRIAARVYQKYQGLEDSPAERRREADIVIECARRAGFPNRPKQPAALTQRLEMPMSGRCGVSVALIQDVDEPHRMTLKITTARGASVVSHNAQSVAFDMTEPDMVRDLGEALIALSLDAERREILEPLRAFTDAMYGS